MAELAEGLRRAREWAQFSQDEVGAALGVSRTMVSYWENGTRTPNDRQVVALAKLYLTDVTALLEGHGRPAPEVDLAGLLLRAEHDLSGATRRAVREFVQFLDRYGELAHDVGAPLRPMRQSPFVHRPRFDQKEDARRKAEEVRGLLGIGVGPIADLDPLCERLGVTVYRASLGGDLRTSPSGAFLNHPDVGFSILVNLDMTPGRRRFTVAHEIAHALFHSNDTNAVLSFGRGPAETFADAFAGEFLMPTEGVRRFIEDSGMPPRITDAADAIHIQRYFNVSWATTVVRLRQMNAVSQSNCEYFRLKVKPLRYAQALGYPIGAEETAQDPSQWRVRRFPRNFLRLLRRAVGESVISVPTAAALADLALPEAALLLRDPGHLVSSSAEDHETEFAEFETTGVF